MKQRLQTLLTSEKIVSSKFADIIGVNRSSISHLLSGRNNPGLDFLQKVLVKFPHVNPDWLLLGQGTMYRNGRESVATLPVDRDLFEKVAGDKPPKEPKGVTAEPHIQAEEPEDRATYIAGKGNSDKSIGHKAAKEAERIVFFYPDGTFDTYMPNAQRNG